MISQEPSQANADKVIAGIRGKSKREAEFFLSTIDLGGNITDRQPTGKLMIEVTEEEMAQIERLRDVLSAGGKNLTHKEALMKAAEDCLEKRDPMRKADRAARRLEKMQLEKKSTEKKSTEKKREARKADDGFPPGQNSEPRDAESRDTESRDTESRDTESRDTESQNMDSKKTASEQCPAALGTGDKGRDKSRRPIPNQIKHQVWLRDQGQCTFMGAGETRCSETRMLEIHHVVPVARSGGAESDNLRLLCRFHNQSEAMRLMGQDTVLRHHASHRASRPN